MAHFCTGYFYDDMDTFSEKELERLKKLKQLRQLLQTILGSHIRLLIAVFVLILVAILLIVYFKAMYSPERYEAQAILYYTPEKTINIPAEDGKYVLQILSQSTMQNKFINEIMHGQEENSSVRPKITVAAIERNKKVDRIDIRVSSRHRGDAIRMTNAFAERCILAYTEARTARLQEMERSLKDKYEEISEELRRIDSEKNSLGVPLLDNALDKEFEQLRQKLSDQRVEQTRLGITIGGLKKHCESLEKKQSALNPELIANEKILREQIAALKKLDDEIMLAENMYTEQNPKMLALLSRRESIRLRLRKFMDEKKIDNDDFGHFEETAELTTSLKETKKELEKRYEEQRVLSEEIKESEVRFARLRDIMPRLQNLNRLYANALESQRRLRNHLAEINTLMPLIKNDLRIGSTSHSASGLMPFSKKNIFVYVFSAISLTLLLASLTVLLEFWMGRVSSADELAIIPELRFLGTLPSSKEMFGSKRQEQMAFSTICHNFQVSDSDHHIVLAGTLPGGKLMPSLFEAFAWSYAMEGKKVLEIDMMLADNFDYEAYPPSDTGIVIYSGGKGFLPVVSKHYLSPSEQMLLKQDLETLRNSYDLIFIKHAVSLRSDRLMLEQLIALCDGAMLVIGAKKTLRKQLRQLIDLQKKTGLSIMTILSEKPSKSANDPDNLEEQA